MRRWCSFLIAAAIVTAPVFAETLEQLEQAWRATNAAPTAAKFEALIPRLLAYRGQSGGKKWQLNYMLGSSYCRIPGQETSGRVALYRVLASYGLPDSARTKAEQVLANCGHQTVAPDEPSFTLVAVSGQMAAVVHDKAGYEVAPQSSPTASKAQPIRVPVEELKKRVFTPDRAREAVSAAIARVQTQHVRGAARSGFVVITGGELPPEMTAECLARYRRPLESQFQMQLPDALITVYVVSQEQLPQYAAELHGVNLPLGTVAYSVYEDLSMVGIAGLDSCGSLGHELVHLAIRQNFGDSPAWLEEGIASEVAVAAPAQSAFHFGESWRDGVLRRRWDLRPTVAQLVSATWADYAAANMDQVSRVAALNAMAAAFIRYLDAQGKLAPVYTAMRDSLGSPEPRPDEEILEKTLGGSLDDIDAAFVRWFKKSP